MGSATYRVVEKGGKYRISVKGRGPLNAANRFLRGLDLTACRAGLLLCNDLETAMRMISGETATVDDISPKEKIQALLSFCISEEYAELRQAIGVAISG